MCISPQQKSKMLTSTKFLHYAQKTGTSLTQFALWYLLSHTIYWGIEQMRYSWCVGCGLQGYIHSLMFSQSIFCKILTETSKFVANQQLNNIMTLTSFIGIKTLAAKINDSHHTKDTKKQKSTQTR
jgi:hypothetical protein